jgi:hypothetical protein
VGLALLCCATGEVRERILCHRAEGLLADMHAIRLHESTWNDAQRLMTRWGAWGHYNGQCTSADCTYEITLQGPSFYSGWWQDSKHYGSRLLVLLRPFRLLPFQFGGGLNELRGAFVVQDGFIRRSGLTINVGVPPWANGGSASGDYELIISAVSRASLRDEWGSEAWDGGHPDYIVWRPGGCTFCLMGRVAYADHVTSAEAQRLSAFDLSCTTRWRPCVTLEQLLPAAREWHSHGPPWGEAPDSDEIVPHASGYCRIPPYALARDAVTIVSMQSLTDSLDQGADCDGVRNEKAQVRLESVLKGNSPWPVGAVGVVSSRGYFEGTELRPPLRLARGRRYFALVDKFAEHDQGVMSFQRCGLVEQTPETEKAVRTGIAYDDPLRGGQLKVSLKGFSR